MSQSRLTRQRPTTILSTALIVILILAMNVQASIQTRAPSDTESQSDDNGAFTLSQLALIAYGSLNMLVAFVLLFFVNC